MRKKIKSEAGFGLVEMLAAVMVMVLLSLMVGAGIEVASNSYQSVVAQSEVELLVSTALDALADDLRYAQEVNKDASEKSALNGTDKFSNFTYNSDSFGKGVGLTLDKGQIKANGKRVLSDGAYGAEGSDETRAYQVTTMKIWYDSDTFEIDLTVQAKAHTDIQASGRVTVRCLNPPKETTPQGGAGE